MICRIGFCLIFALALSGQVSAYPGGDADKVPIPADNAPEMRCTDDGRDCIRLGSYAEDVCKLIERNAAEQGLDPNFLARLLWKESRFQPDAISPAGALGIAQFMPGTAELYDLDDPFNPALSIRKAAWYLAYLRDGFGNIGLAAIAYNGGEARAARFVAGLGGLPYETLDYVESITGYSALRWRDKPPAKSDLRLALRQNMPFRDACEEMATDRKPNEFMVQPRIFPWGVIVATHPDRSGAIRQVSRLSRTLRPILGGKRIGYVRKKLNGMPRAVYTVQVGHDSKREAVLFCKKLQQVGGRCIVLKN